MGRYCFHLTIVNFIYCAEVTAFLAKKIVFAEIRIPRYKTERSVGDAFEDLRGDGILLPLREKSQLLVTYAFSQRSI